MARCVEPEVDWPVECVPDEWSAPERFANQEPWYVGQALQHAAMLLLVGGCHMEDSRPVVWGAPVVEAKCCGQIKTGVTPPVLLPLVGCFSPMDYQWVVKVTWPRDRETTQLVVSEVERLRGGLTCQAECLLEGFDIRRSLRLVGITAGDGGGDCEEAVFTVAVER